jgi:hypothetical protein
LYYTLVKTLFAFIVDLRNIFLDALADIAAQDDSQITIEIPVLISDRQTIRLKNCNACNLFFRQPAKRSFPLDALPRLTFVLQPPIRAALLLQLQA